MMGILEMRSIRVDYFLTLLAFRKCPARDNSVGIKCIVGGQISVKSSCGSEVNWFPVELSSEDMRNLEWTLEVLPELKYPISPIDAELFMQKFLMLKGRPRWLPRLLEPLHIRRDDINRVESYVNLKRGFTELVKSGCFKIYNSRYEYVKSAADDMLIDFGNIEEYASEMGVKIFADEIVFADLPCIDLFADSTESFPSTPLGLNDRLLREGMPSPESYEGGLISRSYGFQKVTT